MRFRLALVAVLAVALAVVPGYAPGAPAGRMHSALISTLEHGRIVHTTLVSHGIAYVGGQNRLAIYDVHKPARPRLLSWGSGWVVSLAKQGHILYVGLGDGSIAVVDVARPRHFDVLTWITAPRIRSAPRSQFPLQLSFEGPVAVRKGMLYAPCQDFRSPFEIYRALCLVDVGHPAAPVHRGQAKLPRDTDATHLLVRGAYVYVAEANYLETVRVGNPRRPAVTRRIKTPTAGLAANGRLLYAGVDSNAGLVKVFSLRHPSRPRPLGTLWGRSYLLDCDDLAIGHRRGHDYLYVAWNTAPESFVWVDVYDVTAPLNRLGRRSLLLLKGTVRGVTNNSISDVTVTAREVYVSQWYRGVRVSRVSL